MTNPAATKVTTAANRKIKKVAVLGSGVMGSRIALHCANIGLQVVLLDIVPNKFNSRRRSARSVARQTGGAQPHCK